MEKYEQLFQDIEHYGKFSFSRSGGPGGQNVNKLNTNVLLTMKIDELTALSDEERSLLRTRVPNRVNSNDELFVQSHQERSQLRNRQLATERMTEIILSAIKKQPFRKKTRPSKAAHQRRLDTKKRRSEIKNSRRRPDFN